MHLKIYRFKASEPKKLFETEPESSTSQMDIHILARIDPAYQATQKAPEGLLLSTEQLFMADSDSILLIDAICLHFTLDFSKPQ